MMTFTNYHSLASVHVHHVNHQLCIANPDNMDQLIVVVVVEGLIVPQVYKVSLGTEDTNYNVITKVRSQFHSRLKQRLDSHNAFHIPSCYLWDDLSNIDYNQCNNVVNDDNVLFPKREGFTLLFQDTLKRQLPESSNMKVKEEMFNQELGTERSCSNVYTVSENVNLPLEQPFRTDTNFSVYSRHSNSTPTQPVETDNQECQGSDSEVVIVSETDGEEETQDSNSYGNRFILSGLNTLSLLKQKRFKQSHDNNDCRPEKGIKQDLVAGFGSMVADRLSENGDHHGLRLAEKNEQANQFDDDDLNDEGIVLERQWEATLDTSDAVESEGMKSDTVKGVCGKSDHVMSEDEDVSSDDVMIVKVEPGDHVLTKRQSSTRRSSRRQTSTHTVKCCNIELTKADLGTLHPYCWLNDKVINSYMKLLMATYGRQYKVHIMNTFFYTKLCNTGYRGVERWLKKINMRKLKLLLVPVHLGTHWCLASIDFRRKRILYFDSMGGTNCFCLKKLRMFLIECSRDGRIKRTTICWRLSHAKDIPRQCNGSDCGVFVCQYARWLCSVPSAGSLHRSRIPFHQKHMPQIRKTMIKELTTGRLINSYQLHSDQH